MRWAPAVALGLMGIAVLYGGYLAFFSAYECRIAATEPGAPEAGEECGLRIYPVPVVAWLLLATAAVGVVVGRWWIAWPAWALATGLSLLFGFSMGVMLYPCGVALLALLLWQTLGRRKEPASPPTP